MIDTTVDHYSVLGVSVTAQIDEIKKSYRKRAMQWHPDRNPNNVDRATIEITKINTAWSILGDPVKKIEYDTARRYSNSPSKKYPSDGYHNTRNQTYQKTDEDAYTGNDGSFFDQSDWDQKTKDTWSDYDRFSEVLKKARKMNEGGMNSDEWSRYGDYFKFEKNADSEIELSISLQDSFTGKVLNVTYTTSSNETKTVRVSIPAGIVTGKKLKCTGGGCSSHTKSDPGDLYIVIEVLVDAVFACDNTTLTYIAEVTPFDIMLGTVLTVPTIDGTTLEVQLRSGMQPGTKIRIPNKGMNTLVGDKRGDMFITLNVVYPDKLKLDQIIILNKAKDAIYS